MVSPLRFEVEDRHVFAQPALSDYFRELAFNLDEPTMDPADVVSLPVRIFDPAALVTSNCTSVLWEMLQRVDYLLIEDADLRPQDLLAHLARFRLNDVVAYDMTSTMRLTGNYAYVLLSARNHLPRLEGERLE